MAWNIFRCVLLCISGRDCYGNNGVLQDIIEAWRLGGEHEDEYIPNDPTGTAETIRVKCDYRARRPGKFACWVGGHHHRDYICRSVKYPNQLVIHLAATGAAERNQASDVGYTPGTKSEDVITVLTVDKISKTVKLVRIGSNITHDMIDRTMTSISWKYDPSAEVQQNIKQLLTELTRQTEQKNELHEYIQEQTDSVSGAVLRILVFIRQKDVILNGG